MNPALPTSRLNTVALGEAVATELDIPLADGRRVVEAVFTVIARALAAGQLALDV
ncbi:hypothetical protein ACIQMY_20870 [Streptomyces sp. NPDC091368]|uniref:hypothetical protein n=1 Tax=Streptomyces sp. NPDC091368 TaxID=3365993 RepID=UPI003827E15C